MTAWAEWTVDAFAQAARLERPILLDLSSGGPASRAASAPAALSDPRVAGLLHSRYVPVRVDVECRPDIAARYSLGATSSLLVLTPEGDILTGGTRIEAGHLAAMLEAVADTFRSRRAELLLAGEEQRQTTGASALRPAGPGHLPDRQAARVFLSHGSAGDEDVLMLAARLRAGVACDDTLTCRAVSDALDRHVLHAPLPRRLVPLASLLELLAQALTWLDRPDLLPHARHVSDALLGLQHPRTGGFALAADDPDVDTRIFADAGAITVRALLHAAPGLDDPDLAARAIAALEQIVLATYSKGRGIGHRCDAGHDVRGLLRDQVEVTAALLDVHDASGRVAYRDLAEELMRSLLRTHWDPAAGAFRDRLHTTDGSDVGLLAFPRYPIAANCLAARILARLDTTASDEPFQSRASDILGAFAGAWPMAGADGHAYVQALLDICPAGQ